MNFSHKWRKWIAGCLGSASTNVLVNGSPSGEFQLERELRQGDPLSPFLFLVVAEWLNVLAERAVHKGLLEPVKVGRDEIGISHLQYADDTMFVATEKMENAWAFKCILKLFEMLSGMSVNFDKSSILGVGIDGSKCAEAADILECNVGELPTKYLGIKIGFFGKGERMRLGKYIGYLSERNLLWARVIRASQGEVCWDGEGFRTEETREMRAGWWKNVLSMSWGEYGKWFRENIEPKIGEGDSFLFWQQRWIGEKRLMEDYQRLNRLSNNQRGLVKEMGEWIEGEWKWKFLWTHELMGRELDQLEDLLSKIQNCRLVAGVKDGWRWKVSPNGLYSVNSAYKMAITTAWKVLKGRVPTSENLRKRQVIIQDSEELCVFCKGAVETIDHLFFECHETEEIWSHILRWVGKQSARHHKAKDHLLAFVNLGNKKDASFLLGVWICTIWCLWKGRNECKFNQGMWSKERMTAEIKIRLWGWRTAFKVSSSPLDFRRWIVAVNLDG
ncbi:uncharacterized protein LOC131025661 [Salvia miltiorrhiza]|uniref:uncharacterized protein LOC131025661 n=1 Tax=Salvia miltiorrhiza TaxID=226208 RepID=UPI0025AC4958|nr:uncharacterized protein LOC131025661 [Salvia miltiorrhiza]